MLGEGQIETSSRNCNNIRPVTVKPTRQAHITTKTAQLTNSDSNCRTLCHWSMRSGGGALNGHSQATSPVSRDTLYRLRMLR